MKAQQVIALRLIKIVSGGADTRREIARMRAENVGAFIEEASKLPRRFLREVVRRHRTLVNGLVHAFEAVTDSNSHAQEQYSGGSDLHCWCCYIAGFLG